MRCSSDLRKRVIEFVHKGSRKAEAARRFQVSRASVSNWLSVPDGLAYRRPEPKGPQRLDWEALRQDVATHPDRTQKERARQFGVSRHGSGYALQRMGLTRKKTRGYRERDPQKRRAYLRLRERYRRRGKTLVYVDESGVAPTVTRRYAYAPKGQRVQRLASGEQRPRTSLLAARIGTTFTAPLLFTGSCDTAFFTAWLARELCPLLHDGHVVVMDNAAFHKSATTHTLIPRTGATRLFLPPYSPDLNPIERDFATLKKHWEYDEHVSLDRLLQTYKGSGA